MTKDSTGETASTWRSGALNGMLFLRADFERQRFRPHSTGGYAIGVIHTDRGERGD